MPGIAKIPYIPGQPVYILASDPANHYLLSSGAVEAFNGAHLTSYELTSVEDGTTGIQIVTFPTVAVVPVALDWVAYDASSGHIVSSGTMRLDANNNEVTVLDSPGMVALLAGTVHLNVKLTADGMDSITHSNPGHNLSPNLPQMIVQLWRRFLGPTRMSESGLDMLDDDQTTVNVTQSLSDNGVLQVVGKVS